MKTKSTNNRPQISPTAMLIKQHMLLRGLSVRGIARDLSKSPILVSAVLHGKRRSLQVETFFETLTNVPKETLWPAAKFRRPPSAQKQPESSTP